MSLVELNGPLSFNGTVDGEIVELEGTDLFVTLCFDPVDGLSFSVNGDLTTVGEVDPPGPTEENFSITAGQVNIYIRGYGDDPFGSASVSNVAGSAFKALYSTNLDDQIRLTLDGTLPQDHFTSIEINGPFSNEVGQKVLNTADASITYVNGATRWEWSNGDSEFVPASIYNCKVVI